MNPAMELLQQPLFALSLFLMAGVILYLAMLRRRQGMELDKIQQLCNRVEQALTETEQETKAARTAFPHLLEEAARHTGFQKPRLKIQAGIAGKAPEKYRYFSTLQQKGMQVEEIAEILGISITEARQLASLRMAAGKKAA
jgi:DNA-directed RNA polymerase specialized sigma24 family protein